MRAVAEIVSAMARLSRREAKELPEWLEDQRETTPEFLASIQRGEADLSVGRAREG